jgi:hypothetical protein
MDEKYNKGEALRMINTRRRGIKDECNEKTNKTDPFTAREIICCSKTSDVLWIIHLCR